MDKIPRVVGIFLSGGILLASAANVTSPQPRSLGVDIAVWFGLIVGNYCYASLWMDEGRARERADQEKRRQETS